ncbi:MULTISPECIES: hypothetical protein [Acidithiobacillus]|jgi:hypothetical protein|uniref:Uncharacterized protein n=2 Tax=Acidithiobacillus TaxID=119977 RepID=A0A179BHZ3_ACIFR|nr:MULTISPECIES: hypothetical protein [Acidithiobacillus]MBU2846081.1 hypothetical protein [Acidithiobacillus ferriphilus]MEB8474457.1 hypothetical protein [Acidithiobacillus ferriphilus]MEB8488356.1 hypothetical protein [Acidithiobacillus ferriphilus]MEB8490663.1 hypothetical protein [Acidithiobacillus ferriphilus]MEB8493576.1 hypothetical protein [Acidithiobacillus ferriphilus]
MILDIQAPDLPFKAVTDLAKNLADTLNLKVIHDGHGRLIFRPATEDGKDAINPIVSVPARPNLPVKTAQALRKVQMVAPKSAVLATDGARIAVIPHPAKNWKEVKV